VYAGFFWIWIAEFTIFFKKKNTLISGVSDRHATIDRHAIYSGMSV